jgi:ABC-type sugar transport system permease subunit
MLAPFLIVFFTFVAYPVLQSLLLSCQQTYGPRTSVFVGWQNYVELARDPLFWVAVRNTLLFSVISVVLQIPLALGLAILLNNRVVMARPLLRLMYFSPALVGVAYVAVLFGPFLEKNTGVINVSLDHLIRSLGLSNWIPFDVEFAWLENYILPALILASLWMYTGFNMVYFLAALQNIDQSLIDASVVDGAGSWARFWNVVLPGIRPVALFVLLWAIIGSVQVFELPYILLNFAGGPENRGLTVVMYLYQIGFESRDLGFASAIGWVLTFSLIAVAIVHRKFSKRYEDA